MYIKISKVNICLQIFKRYFEVESVFSLRPLPGRRSATKRKQGGSVLPIHNYSLPTASICSFKHILWQGVSRSTLFTCFCFRSRLTNEKLPIHNSPDYRDFKAQLKDCYKSWHGWYRGVVQLVFRKQIGCSREKQVKNWMQWAGTGQRWVNPPDTLRGSLEYFWVVMGGGIFQINFSWTKIYQSTSLFCISWINYIRFLVN